MKSGVSYSSGLLLQLDTTFGVTGSHGMEAIERTVSFLNINIHIK